MILSHLTGIYVPPCICRARQVKRSFAKTAFTQSDVSFSLNPGLGSERPSRNPCFCYSYILLADQDPTSRYGIGTYIFPNSAVTVADLVEWNDHLVAPTLLPYSAQECKCVSSRQISPQSLFEARGYRRT